MCQNLFLKGETTDLLVSNEQLTVPFSLAHAIPFFNCQAEDNVLICLSRMFVTFLRESGGVKPVPCVSVGRLELMSLSARAGPVGGQEPGTNQSKV